MSEDFEKLDPSFMEEFKGLREKKPSPETLKNFKASVEAKILERQHEKRHQNAWLRWSIPVFAPALGALLFFVWANFPKLSSDSRGTARRAPTMVSIPIVLSSVSNVTDLTDEITALEELGVWTDEDEATVVG